METDEDDMLLAQLTEEEIAELSRTIDPDNELLPPSQRMPSQTEKETTGPLDRKHLLDHLKKQAQNSKVGEDYVPFIPKSKPEDEEQQKEEVVKKPKDVFSNEFDDILNELDEEDIAELASELGMHGLLNQAQSRGDPGASLKTKCTPKPTIDYDYDPPQSTDLLEAITSLEDNDPYLTELNLNNHSLITSQHIFQILDALKTNTYLETLSMVNVSLDDRHTSSLVEALRENEMLKSLNLESNRLTITGLKAVIKSLADNSSLKEIRLANQIARGGHRLEADIAKMLENNTTLLKFGYAFTSNGPRFQVEKFLMRNTDMERQRRQDYSV